MNTFKICLIGGPNTGKTTFIRRHKDGQFLRNYVPTIGTDVQSLILHTNAGQYCLKIWDTAGQEKFKGLGDAYYLHSDAAIAFYTSHSVDVTKQCVKDFIRVCDQVPIINVWNKTDLPEEAQFVKTHARINNSIIVQGRRTTYLVSARSNYNFEKPFLEILRQLTKNPQLQFIEKIEKIEKIENTENI